MYGGAVAILDEVRASAAKRLLLLPHAVRQMARPERMLSPKEVVGVVNNGEVIEDYPHDSRGHSYLMLGHGDRGRPIHVLCSPKVDYLAIITAYLPDPTRWSADFRRRN